MIKLIMFLAKRRIEILVFGLMQMIFASLMGSWVLWFVAVGIFGIAAIAYIINYFFTNTNVQ